MVAIARFDNQDLEAEEEEIDGQTADESEGMDQAAEDKTEKIAEEAEDEAEEIDGEEGQSA